MSINWSLYEQDAVKKYMDDRMSAKDTCKWINDKYGTSISYVLFSVVYQELTNRQSEAVQVKVHGPEELDLS